MTCPAIRRVAPLALLLAWATASHAQANRPAAVDARPLARLIPGEDLVGLLEFDGADAHAAAWKASAAYKILNETKLGLVLESLAGQAAELALADAPQGKKPNGPEAVAMAKRLFAKGFAVALHGNGRDERTFRVTLVVRGAGGGEGRKVFGKALNAVDERSRPKNALIGRRTVRVFGPEESSAAYWFEGDDLVAAGADRLSATLAVSDGRDAGAVDDPSRVALRAPVDGLEPFAAGFLDASALPKLPPQAEAAGLGGITRVELRWGVQDDALVTILRVVAPSPRPGLLGLADGPPFALGEIPPMPPAVRSFTVASADVRAAYGRVAAWSARPGRASAGRAAAMEREFERATTLRLRDDVLARLGPRLALFARPGDEIVLPIWGGGLLALPRLTLTAQVDDAAAFRRMLDTLATAANARMAATPGTTDPPRFVKLPGEATAYALALPKAAGMPDLLQPTVLVGKGYAALALTVGDATDATAVGPRWAPGADHAATARRLPRGMALLHVDDPRETLPASVVNLPKTLATVRSALATPARPDGPPLRLAPGIIPRADELSARLFPGSLALSVDAQGWTITRREAVPGLLSPATGAVAAAALLQATPASREADRRAACSNNLKRIALAMLSVSDATATYPPAAILSPSGTPLLSWRVALLPHLGERALYERFHLNEPWDAPYNKSLLASMPEVYRCPGRAPAPGTTAYRLFTGPGSAFDSPKGIAVNRVVDGAAATFGAVEAREAVPWTKPEGLPLDVDPAAVARLLGPGHPGGFVATFLDGSVRSIKLTIDPKTLRAFVTRDGGEAVRSAP